MLSDKHQKQILVKEVYLEQTVQKVLQTLNSLVNISKTTIHLDFSSINTIKFNEAYLYSIFLNLITNSIKYAKPNALPQISIHSEQGNDFTKVIFKDNDIGFNMKEVEDKIFGIHQKFQTSSDSKGIGLYLVYNHIQSLNGKIEVKSIENGGSTFTLLFKNLEN